MTQRLFTEEQRAAVVRAVIEHGMTTRQAADAAAEGRLGPPPFELSRETVAAYARVERERRREAGTAPPAPTRTRKRIALLQDRVLEQLERAVSELEVDAKDNGHVDLGRLRQVTGALKQAKQVIDGENPWTMPDGRTPAEQSSANTWLAGLAEKADLTERYAENGDAAGHTG